MRAKDRNGDLMKTNRIALELFLTFGKVGIFTFGGGYAMIPLIQKEIVETKKWISNDDILEILAIAESTPGPIAINAATFTGYCVRGAAVLFYYFGTFLRYAGISGIGTSAVRFYRNPCRSACTGHQSLMVHVYPMSQRSCFLFDHGFCIDCDGIF